MTIEIVDTDLVRFLNTEVEVLRLATGFQFVEGPLWDPVVKRLLFSDISADMIFEFHPGTDPFVFLQPSHFANGLAFDINGALLACEHETRRVVRIENRQSTVLADSYQGKRLNSPNDLLVLQDGSILFTDPTYGLREGLGGPADQELDFQGVYRIVPGKRELHLLVDDFEAPNGVAISVNQQTLYINDTVRRHIRIFQVDENWALSGGEVLLELLGSEEGKPDGMIIDQYGHIYCTGPGGIWIIHPEGALMGRIHIPERVSNLTWGDEKLSSLYITAGGSLYAVRDLIRDQP
ncbi:MAG: SMP-30/gluconolactonase/LRE family protein [Anaerolineales bacterium]